MGCDNNQQIPNCQKIYYQKDPMNQSNRCKTPVCIITMNQPGCNL